MNVSVAIQAFKDKFGSVCLWLLMSQEDSEILSDVLEQ